MSKSITANLLPGILHLVALIFYLVDIYQKSLIIEGYYRDYRYYIPVIISGILAAIFLGRGLYLYLKHIKPEEPSSGAEDGTKP